MATGIYKRNSVWRIRYTGFNRKQKREFYLVGFKGMNSSYNIKNT
jgi:hypothetical protein